MQWPGNEPEETHFDDLTDEIKRVMEDSLDEEGPSSPRPEDVPVDEPWLVKVNGKTAIGYRNDPDQYFPWFVKYRNYAGSEHMDDAGVTLVAPVVSENAEQDDVPEFEPSYTYADRYGLEWCYADGGWRLGGHRISFPYSTPPAHRGPYSRVDKEGANE